MADYPIMFSPKMINALILGEKFVTRRHAWTVMKSGSRKGQRVATIWQKVVPGDRLWVRERVWHKDKNKFTPAIHLRRADSRFTLLVTETHSEGLQRITERDALREGFPAAPGYVNGDAIAWYHLLWDELHGPASWGENPIVVRMRFLLVTGNIDSMRIDREIPLL